MDAFAKMDIFFIVTTFATFVLAMLVGMLLFYVIRAARDVSRITHVVRGESERFANGTKSARRGLHQNFEKTAQWLVALVQSFGGKRTRNKK